MSISITDAQYATLQSTGTVYAKLLGVAPSDIQDMLSTAIVGLLESLSKNPEWQWEDVKNVWKACIKQAVLLDYRRSKHVKLSGVARDYAMEMSEKGPEEDYVWQDFQDKVLNKAYDILSDDDMLVLVSYVDCNLNIADTAKYLNIRRTNLYHVIKKIRAKVQKHFPEHREKAKATFTQEYRFKDRDWHFVWNCVEVVDYIGWSPAFFDPNEAAKEWDCRSVTER